MSKRTQYYIILVSLFLSILSIGKINAAVLVEGLPADTTFHRYHRLLDEKL